MKNLISLVRLKLNSLHLPVIFIRNIIRLWKRGKGFVIKSHRIFQFDILSRIFVTTCHKIYQQTETINIHLMHKVFHSRRKSSFKKIRKEKTRAIYCKQLIKKHTRTQSKENLSTKIGRLARISNIKRKKKISNFYKCTIRSKRPKETRDATNAESTRERESCLSRKIRPQRGERQNNKYL